MLFKKKVYIPADKKRKLKRIKLYGGNKLTRKQIDNLKFVRVMFGTESKAGDGYSFKIGEVNIAEKWNPKDLKPENNGGFNFSLEEKILRWICRGDVLYDVTIPDDAEVIDSASPNSPHGVFITNKIIVTNPRPLTDELVMELYNKSELPDKSIFAALPICASRGYNNTAKKIISDMVNESNVDEVIEIFKDWTKDRATGEFNEDNLNESTKLFYNMLLEIKDPLCISVTYFKEPYIKCLTKDNVINLTGQTGSGKSTYAKNHFSSDKYEIIDTDEIFVDSRFEKSNGLNRSLGEYFRKKYEKLPQLEDNFDLIYKEIMDYCKNLDKTIVIDCAKFHCCKDYSILKGKIIIIRTDIDTCYDRAISRWIEKHKNNKSNDFEQELNNYKERKKRIYLWYKETNEFIKNIDLL